LKFAIEWCGVLAGFTGKWWCWLA